jgi:transcriptional regulator with XRE-family HTH domain
MSILSPQTIRHVMDHPARGTPWRVRELAAVIGCSVGTISHIRNGQRASIPTELADRFAEAVGVETAVLFAPSVSAQSDTTGDAA